MIWKIRGLITQWDLANMAGIKVMTGGREENGWGLLVICSTSLSRLELNTVLEAKLRLLWTVGCPVRLQRDVQDLCIIWSV